MATEGDVPVPPNRCPLLALTGQGLSSRGRDGRARRRHGAVAAVGGCPGTRQAAKSRHRGGQSKRSAWPGGYSCTARKVDCESVMSKNPQLAIMDLAHDDHWRIPLWMKGGHLQPSPYRRFHAREPHTLAAYPAHPPAHELSRITRARRSSRRARYTARRHIQIAAPPRRWPAQVETRRRAARARRGERFVNGGL